MLILFFSSLSLAALAGLLALNSVALRNLRARQNRVATPTWDLSPRSSLSPTRCDAQWNGDAWISNEEVARQKAAQEARQKAKQEAWDASLAGRTTHAVAVGIVWAVIAAVVLALALPFVFLFGWLFVGFGSTITLVILIAWCLNDFKNDVAEEVVKRQKLGR